MVTCRAKTTPAAAAVGINETACQAPTGTGHEVGPRAHAERVAWPARPYGRRARGHRPCSEAPGFGDRDTGPGEAGPEPRPATGRYPGPTTPAPARARALVPSPRPRSSPAPAAALPGAPPAPGPRPPARGSPAPARRTPARRGGYSTLHFAEGADAQRVAQHVVADLHPPVVLLLLSHLRRAQPRSAAAATAGSRSGAAYPQCSGRGRGGAETRGTGGARGGAGSAGVGGAGQVAKASSRGWGRGRGGGRGARAEGRGGGRGRGPSEGRGGSAADRCARAGCGVRERRPCPWGRAEGDRGR